MTWAMQTKSQAMLSMCKLSQIFSLSLHLYIRRQLQNNKHLKDFRYVALLDNVLGAFNDVNKLSNSRRKTINYMSIAGITSAIEAAVLTLPLLSVEFRSFALMPFSRMSLKQSLSRSSLQLRDARKSFVTTSIWSRLILKALSRADSNELLQVTETKNVYF